MKCAAMFPEAFARGTGVGFYDYENNCGTGTGGYIMKKFRGKAAIAGLLIVSLLGACGDRKSVV